MPSYVWSLLELVKYLTDGYHHFNNQMNGFESIFAEDCYTNRH